MADFDTQYPHARTAVTRPGWPADVRSISQDGLDYIGVDSRGRLYWDGRMIEVARTLSLTKAQNWIALIGVGAAVAVAVVEWLRFIGLGVR